MNSMEEEATQLESEVLRKILRQPKESAPKKAKDKGEKTKRHREESCIHCADGPPRPAVAS